MGKWEGKKMNALEAWSQKMKVWKVAS